VKQIYDDELKVTFKGITDGNPKSYSAWYQRSWVLHQHPQPDLKAELELCEKSLGFDCRNFHCWDHRRVVAKLAGLDSDEEFAFLDRLIKANPSNYSAWHYRGTLLQNLQKANDPSRLLSDECVAKELEVRQTFKFSTYECLDCQKCLFLQFGRSISVDFLSLAL
jgi:geranylgeranyl transferase type-2 subunit alpha